jgi:hypothetical protein
MQTTTKTVEQARAEILGQMKGREAELVKAAEGLRNVLLGEGFIVECDGIWLTFDVVGGYAENPRNCRPENCMRFTREVASMLSHGVVNGRGTKGRPVHVRDAVEQALLQTREVIAMVEQTVEAA